MLDILLIIGGVLVLLILGILALASTKPKIFSLSRQEIIRASPERLFPLIANFRNFIRWSPFENDPDMKRNFSGPEEGAGAVYSFDGNKNVGAGRVEILKAVPASDIVMRLDFLRPMKTTNEVLFRLTPLGDDTEVTWSMSGPAPLFSRVMQVFFDMDKMVGSSFEKGLASLKALAENERA